MSHAAQSIKHWGVAGLVKNSLRSADQLLNWKHESDVQPNDGRPYASAIRNEDYGESGDTLQATRGVPGNGEECNAAYGRIASIWKRFARLICGQEGPFSRGGVRKKPDEVAKLRQGLWPECPPQHGEKWLIHAGYTPADFEMTLSFLSILIFSC